MGLISTIKSLFGPAPTEQSMPDVQVAAPQDDSHVLKLDGPVAEVATVEVKRGRGKPKGTPTSAETKAKQSAAAKAAWAARKAATTPVAKKDTVAKKVASKRTK